jgi:hypothetical protein
LNLRYIAALAIAAWLLAVLMLRYRAWRRRNLSVQWPLVAGTFRSGVVSSFRTGYMGDSVRFRLSVEFSYHVGDSVYPGIYVQGFGTEEDAAALMRSLEQGPLYVRYDPDTPSENVVDPYRDVYVPDAPDLVHQGPAAITEIHRRGSNPLRSPVSLGQMVIAQMGFVILLYITSTRGLIVFWFLAAGHALGAVMTTGCCLWTPAGRRLPTWVGRLALAVVAFGWVFAARMLRAT